MADVLGQAVPLSPSSILPLNGIPKGPLSLWQGVQGDSVPLQSRAPTFPYRRVGSRRSRSQSPRRETERVVRMMVKAGASRIQGARVRYSRP
jgi:hypothetical protein